ncbi:MAG: phosphoenolpyruvate carboxykinase (ATP), partial [Desulfobulbaceae bacterium]|nr:phosphoenolpyruvate carboxykinase (ATP) [Desulfobulbaceae bacterium]
MATITLHEEGIRFAAPLRLNVFLALAGNCREIVDSQTLHDLSLGQDNVLALERPMQNPALFGLRPGSRQLLWNHRNPVGRTAAARRFWHEADVEQRKELSTITREAALGLQAKGSIATTAYAGLDEEFCVGLRFVGNRDYPVAALSFLLNFQGFVGDRESRFYAASRKLDVPDLLMVYDPDWRHPDHEKGLVVIDRESKTIFVLGLPYFGEIKKGFLTLIWHTAIAERVNGTHIRRFLPIHGSICVVNGKTVVIIALSGSGKSSLSAKAESIAHDDAFVVSMVTGKVIVLEPTFFNKTDGDEMGDETTGRGLIFFNMGVVGGAGHGDVVPGDRLVANGRVIQERPANAVNGYDRVDVLSLVMKDDTLPPVSLINDPALFVAFGASLMTKRTLAEALKRVEEQYALIIEPFAQPFRSWRFNTECRMFQLFLELFRPLTVILNTGDFMGRDIDLAMSRDLILPALTSGALEFAPWRIVPRRMMSLIKKGSLGAEYDRKFVPKTGDSEYVARFVSRMQSRIDYLTRIREQNLIHAD